MEAGNSSSSSSLSVRHFHLRDKMVQLNQQSTMNKCEQQQSGNIIITTSAALLTSSLLGQHLSNQAGEDFNESNIIATGEGLEAQWFKYVFSIV